jgi:hypothetical protein
LRWLYNLYRNADVVQNTGDSFASKGVFDHEFYVVNENMEWYRKMLDTYLF